MIHENVLQVVGNTPIVRLNRITQGLAANFYAKLEFMNPGGSVKDRIGLAMIEDAEKRGLIRPGGTIVEATSGNTGVGLALAAAIKGYKCIFVLPDKMSSEKIRNLRSFGAKVVVTPSSVEPEDPRSHYSTARRLAAEMENSIYMNQYDNLSNREAHYRTTGPEILRQMPEIDVLVGGMGTGGTICGTARYLKEKKPSVKIVVADPIGSIIYDVFKTGRQQGPAGSYKMEGIGEDFIPQNFDLKLVDEVIQIEDKESFLITRDLLTKEGIYCGVSAGAALIAAMKWVRSQGEAMKNKNVLVIIPDSGNRYQSKVFNDDWMREVGFLDKPSLGTVADLLLATGHSNNVVMARQNDTVATVIELLRTKDISQVPVTDSAGWIKGVVSEGDILSALFGGRVKATDTVANLTDPSIEFVTAADPVEKISQLVTAGKVPLVTEAGPNSRIIGIITKIDVLTYLGKRA
ncbi:MAG: pyridoxal-5'-phosphate-dependent protein subunit beta [Bdellovibrionales bacterium GWB1_55_8]|nr:MAG: pyridoxal-5'-phosphate-dependent protein subunit beta [Bdellovibrionales bacterium GWB1_55_8]